MYTTHCNQNDWPVGNTAGSWIKDQNGSSTPIYGNTTPSDDLKFLFLASFGWKDLKIALERFGMASWIKKK